LELGGSVQQGEKGTQIVFFKPIDKKKEKDIKAEKENSLPFVLCHYTVFNVEQCWGLNVPEIINPAPNTVESIDAASVNSRVQEWPQALSRRRA
jgi:antirestriction protein ArdC